MSDKLHLTEGPANCLVVIDNQDFVFGGFQGDLTLPDAREVKTDTVRIIFGLSGY